MEVLYSTPISIDINFNLREIQMIKFITHICKLNASFEDNISSGTSELRKELWKNSNANQKSRYIYKFLMQSFSFQGISDRAAITYRNEHGDITFFQINKKLSKYNSLSKKCIKLKNFNSYTGCGYEKSEGTCNNHRLIKNCPVPTHDLRNGKLNQMAYSLYFFIRDTCNGNLIEFINSIIQRNLTKDYTYREIITAKNELLTEFTKIFNIGNKVASMALSDLLLSDLRKPKWNMVGRSMVAVDRLVHKFLNRTGILKYHNATHDYGKKCDTICTDIVIEIAEKIDAKKINKKYPSFYPRFIQHSIFHFCATDGLSFCNEKSVGDLKECAQTSCFYYNKCDRNKIGSLK